MVKNKGLGSRRSSLGISSVQIPMPPIDSRMTPIGRICIRREFVSRMDFSISPFGDARTQMCEREPSAPEIAEAKPSSIATDHHPEVRGSGYRNCSDAVINAENGRGNARKQPRYPAHDDPAMTLGIAAACTPPHGSAHIRASRAPLER